MSKLNRREQRQKRHRRVRGQVSGTPRVPRMSVCRTNKHIYVQFIDDTTHRTLASASTLDPAFREAKGAGGVEGAVVLGKMAAEKALATDIKKVVFDRGGFKFHGHVKALADAAREVGLEF